MDGMTINHQFVMDIQKLKGIIRRMNSDQDWQSKRILGIGLNSRRLLKSGEWVEIKSIFPMKWTSSGVWCRWLWVKIGCPNE